MLHSPLFLSLTASLLLPLNYLYNTLIINKLNYCMYLYIYYQIELFNRLDYFVSALMYCICNINKIFFPNTFRVNSPFPSEPQRIFFSIQILYRQSWKYRWEGFKLRGKISTNQRAAANPWPIKAFQRINPRNVQKRECLSRIP